MVVEVREAVAPPAPAVPGPRPYRFTVEDYHRMGKTGILGPETRTELLDGVVYEMTPIGPPHGWGTNDLDDWFRDKVRRRARVTNQTPLALGDDGEPVPDLMLVRPGTNRRSHPRPADVLLVVEVTDTTATHDLHDKALRYAQASIPEYWVYLITRPELIVHRNPSPDGYKAISRHAPGEPVNPLAFPDLSFDLAELVAEDADEAT